MALFNLPVLIRGGGDLGSGVAFRLFRAGFPVVILELERPILVRPEVSFGTAVFRGSMQVEGVEARRVTEFNPERDSGFISILVDPEGRNIDPIHPAILIDARMAKVNLGTQITDAPLVIGMGPGFTASIDCHVVIETNRGHTLGRALWTGAAEPDTGTPGVVNGRGSERVIRAPQDGYVTRQLPVGEFVREGTPVAYMNDTPLIAPFDGMLRGLIHESVFVRAGQKVGDLDPRAKREHCFTISDKALAIAGGVMEAVFSAPQIQNRLQSPYL